MPTAIHPPPTKPEHGEFPKPVGAARSPVYVDLDGTLIRSDLLIESALKFAKTHPLSVFLLPVWLCGGKAALKTRLARRVEIDATTLPYDPEVLACITAARAAGRRVVLATASHRRYADAVAGHLGLFDGVLASDSETNLSGKNKLAAIKRDAGGPFCYLGDARVDLAIWQEAESAVVVSADASLVRRAARLTKIDRQIVPARCGAGALLKAGRLHQWAKNLLIALPFLPVARQLPAESWAALVIGFVCFGLCASSVYLLNDLLDLESDRQHPRKRTRPLASGVMPLHLGLFAAPVCLTAAFGLAAAFTPWMFLAVLAGYWICTLAYSLRLKRHMVFDVTTLAGLYTLRILAGAALIGIPPSFWILAFSMFLFHSLACLKRAVELQSAQERRLERPSGRGYFVSDMPVLLIQGVATGMLAVLVFALYINDPATHARFVRPQALWAVCPLLLFWISRIWIVGTRGELHDDPVVFALRDAKSLAVGVLAALAFAAALFP